MQDKLYLGVDIGGMSIKIGVVDQVGRILQTATIVTENITPEDQAVKIAESIEELIKTNGYSKDDFTGVGVGCPGSIDTKNGVVRASANLNWNFFPLKEILETKLGMYVRVANDADAAALAEVTFGSAKAYSDAILLTIGTGVGGGIVINKKLYEGYSGMAGELGHITMFYGGLPCGCGRNGCFEQYASASALIRITKEFMLKDKTSAMWEEVQGDIEKVNGITSFKCAKSGDKTANEVVDLYISYVSEGILNYCNIFRPEAIIIGGGISKEGDYLIDKIKAYCKKFSYGYKGTVEPEILVAKLGNSAGIIGAASLVI